MTDRKNASFTEIVRMHSEKYPLMQAQDYVKLAYQHTLGPGHMVKDFTTALNRIQEERNSGENGVSFEMIGNGLTRMHLSGNDAFLSGETIARMFMYTASSFHPAENGLKEALDAISALIACAGLPVSQADFTRYLSTYKQSGMPLVSHTEVYRNAYAPKYRVIKDSFQTFSKIYEALEEIKRRKPGAIVAIDGMCASGKSTLAEEIAFVMDAPLFHMDDYFLPMEKRTEKRLQEIGGNVDRERFYEEILLPLSEGKSVRFRPFDCSQMALLPPVAKEAGQINIVEGAYACHPDLIEKYDFIICMNIDPALQRERILKRDGERMLRRFENEWIPMELNYLNHFKIAENANLTYMIQDNA
ncbi:MAG: hypothetical protein IJC48_08510 [Clostridia bacterium]|nr:hypothetical protein [Clostridia bacterium]